MKRSVLLLRRHMLIRIFLSESILYVIPEISLLLNSPQGPLTTTVFWSPAMDTLTSSGILIGNLPI